MTDIQTTLFLATQDLNSCSDTPQLDAEVLLGHVLAKPRSHLRAWPEKQLTQQQHTQVQQLFEERVKGAPIAYLIGHQEFWSRDFKVSSDVLIPRPDTELLIEHSLGLMADKKNPRLIDLGTGSGIIAITLAAERPDLEVIATDISLPALKIAGQNAQHFGMNAIQFIHSDWLTEVTESIFDLIISNPPYIPQNDPHLVVGDLRFEPDIALIAADQGLRDISIICQQARPYLKTDASLLIEHGYDLQPAVQSLFESFGYTNILTFTDLSGHPRITTGQWQA